MEFITDYRTERYVLQTKWEDLPKEAQTHVLMSAVDLMGALILGSYGRQFAAGEKLAQTLGFSGEIPVIGSEARYSLPGAAIAMGHASNSFDIDDGYREIRGHPGTSFVAGTLASALKQDVSWKEYLTALAVCYETTIRWALAMQDYYGFPHSTGAYGAFGTTAGIGRLLGLDEKTLNTALSIADYHAPMTPSMHAVEYPSMNKDGVPFGALVGTMAVMEALSGSTGRTHFLELEKYRVLTESLGKRFYVTELYYKPYTCCRWTHQPIRACLDLMKEHSFSAKDVEHVTVHTFTPAALLSKIVPHETDEAQYNIAYPVACALVHKEVGFLQVREEALDDPAVLDMMTRLEFAVDPELDRLFPGKRLARVEIRLKDGRVLLSGAYEAAGEPDDPELGPDWIAQKFRRITAPMLEPEAQEELLELMSRASDIPVRTVVEKINSTLKRGI